MMRFSYTDMAHKSSYTCKECKKKRTCKKLAKYKSMYYKDRTSLCCDFDPIPRKDPKVTLVDCDCRELLHQITISHCVSKSIINSKLLGLAQPNEPSIEDMEIFIKLLKEFTAHILDYREMYMNCYDELSDLIQTVIVVKDKNISAYLEGESTSITLLRNRLNKVANEEGVIMQEEERNVLLGKNVIEVEQKPKENI